MNYNRLILKLNLAQMYYPECNPKTALKKFRAEIDETPGLLEALKALKLQPKEKNR